WIGTKANGILRKSGSVWTIYDTSIIENQTAGRPTQLHIRFDSKGNTYTKGKYIYKFNGSTWSVFDNLSVNTAFHRNDFRFDSKDNLWASVGKSLENGTWNQHFTLPANYIFFGGIGVADNDIIYTTCLHATPLGDTFFIAKYDGLTTSIM